MNSIYFTITITGRMQVTSKYFITNLTGKLRNLDIHILNDCMITCMARYIGISKIMETGRLKNLSDTSMNDCR